LLQFKGEIAFDDSLMDGIGLQGVVAVPISDAKENNMTLEVKQQSGVYITLTNPDTQPEDLRVSVLLGYASTDWKPVCPRWAIAEKTKTLFLISVTACRCRIAS
jgi:hypothetical protein